MRFKLILVGVAAASLLAAAGFALADINGGTRSLGGRSLRHVSSPNVTCPNNLTNFGVGAATCARNATTTTTSAPPTTTTVPPTPTSVRPTPTTTAPTATAAPPVAAATQPSGGNCTNPSFSTSDASGADNTDPSDGSQYWWVNNDAWSGTHGPQTLDVCNQASWHAVSNQPDVGGQVETYADTEYDVGGRSGGSTTPISAWSSITSTFSEAFPPAGAWDAAYDLWLNNWSTEVMIWNQWAGAQAYWPSQATTALTLDGVPYHFYNNGGELMFFRDAQTSLGTVDILAALQWLVAQGLVKSTDVPTQLEYGVEVCSTSGAETFPLTGLSFNLS
jgi:hypothetical protein